MKYGQWFTSAVIFALIGSATAQPLAGEPFLDSRHKQTAVVTLGDHHRCYRFSARWAVKKSSDGNFWGKSPDQLERIEIVFTGAPERANIVFDIKNTHTEKSRLLRNTLNFFWAPEKRWDEKAKGWTTIQYKNFDRINAPRFDLAPIQEEKLAGVHTENKEKDKIYPILFEHFVIARNSWKPDYSSNPPKFEITSKGLRNTLELFRRMGDKRGRGRVQMLIEEGQPPHHFLIVYWPESDPWLGAFLASPGLDRNYQLDIVEPFTNLDRQRNLAQLPQGTWERLKKLDASNENLLAVGRNGLVTYTTDSSPKYTVHLLKATAASSKNGTSSGKDSKQQMPLFAFAEPRITRGLSKSLPPSWAGDLNIRSDWTPAQGRHLIALSVCSRVIWGHPRPTKDDPSGDHPEHKPLPLHPELWALSPYSPKIGEQ